MADSGVSVAKIAIRSYQILDAKHLLPVKYDCILGATLWVQFTMSSQGGTVGGMYIEGRQHTLLGRRHKGQAECRAVIMINRDIGDPART